ncbi:hypothetical protein PMI41_04917 [Phyllobacterium sp. YR531]|nr:hypothetical protein PMI41_04917 [Phyllobacterium sp. YR531]
MWWDYVENPLYLKSIYDSAPSLDRVEIIKLDFDREGPSLLLTFSTEFLPSHPPVKWDSFDRVTFQLRL